MIVIIISEKNGIINNHYFFFVVEVNRSISDRNEPITGLEKMDLTLAL